MKNYIIYKLTFPSKKVYIGQTSNLTRRFYQYKAKQVKRQPFLQSCLEKYDWEDIIKEVLHTGLSKEQADQKEIELIALQSSNCVNIASGGKSGLCKSIVEFDLSGKLIKTWNNVLEICDHFSIAYSAANYIGEICRSSGKAKGNRYRDSLWLYKNLHDKGIKPQTSNFRALVYKMDENEQIIETFNSCKEAADKLGVSYMAVKQAIYRKQKCKGFHLKH